MPPKTIFIFAYYSFKDPVFQSAVLPYFINLPHKEQFRFVLLTFRQSRFNLPASEQATIDAALKNHNIIWYHLWWHSGRFKIIKKIFDFCVGFLRSIYLVFYYRADIIYSEGFPGVIIAHWISRVTGKKHIVHTFEPHADYMIESGVWKSSSWEALLIKKLEKSVARHAYAILTATDAMIEKWNGKTSAKLYRVPSCVDLEHFQFSQEKRMIIRRKYGIKENEVVFVYLGKFGGMYMDKEIIEFFNQVEKFKDLKYEVRFMLLTPESIDKVEDLINNCQISRKRYIIENLSREDVPAYLSSADIAFCGIKPIPSRKYSSPIKNGEYWACGLPVIIPEGISDDYIMAEKYKIGWSFSTWDHNGSIHVIEKVFRDWDFVSAFDYRRRARDFVMKDRDVNQYKEKYYSLFSNLGS